MRFLDWLLDRDNCRSHPALLTSMTGEALLRSGGGRSWYTTETGRTRIAVSHSMTLGDNAKTSKMIINGEYDFCLTKADKEGFIKQIRSAVDRGGEFLYTKRNKKGNLDFVKGYWNKLDLQEIKYLLEKLT